jgi:hypothetical protein
LLHLLSLRLANFEDAIFQKQAALILLGMEGLEMLILMIEETDAKFKDLAPAFGVTVGVACLVCLLPPIKVVNMSVSKLTEVSDALGLPSL